MLYADECQLQTADICSLLRVCYTASGAIKSLEQVDTMDENNLYIWIERSSEIFRSPMYTVFTQDTVDVPLIISDESLLGPLSLIRTLLVLARRGLLDEIPGWTNVPDNTSPSTSLGQIKQITSPDIIRKIVTLALKRVGARLEKGKMRLDENDQDYARVAVHERCRARPGFDCFQQCDFPNLGSANAGRSQRTGSVFRKCE